jgi:hypothetical protein
VVSDTVAAAPPAAAPTADGGEQKHRHGLAAEQPAGQRDGGAAAEQQQQQLVGAESIERYRGHAEHRQHPCLHRRASQCPCGLHHDRDDDRLDPIQGRRRLGTGGVGDVRPREREDDRHRRHDEARAAQQQSGPARPHVAEVDGHLRRVGPRDEVRHAEQVQETCIVDPTSRAHHLVAHHGDVRGGTAEADDAELQEESDDLAKRAVTRRR